MLLADLGAEVIKIEGPQGDIGRNVGPHWIGRHNAYFASFNRNKQSVCLDLTTKAGQRDLASLARSAHALITNMRPSAIRKLGLTYEALKHHNPRLACVALTGYGLEGRYADRPAYDYVVQALAGVAALTGDPDGPPIKVGFSTVDNSTGIMAAVGLLAKIVEGTGGQVDVSMYDTMLSQLNYLAGAYLNAGEEPRRYPNGAHPYIVPAQIFPTRDGYLAIFISHDRFWRCFAQEIGREDWLNDARFATMQARSQNRDLVVEAIEDLLRTNDTAHWVGRLDPLGIVVAGVQDLASALQSDLTRDREMVQTVKTADGPIQTLGSPIRCDGGVAKLGPPPLLGEHNDKYLPVDKS
jgi:crotonobetainyl-CoA:carnitine CoA-transferase CaiB-like acyl-CoA transferase